MFDDIAFALRRVVSSPERLRALLLDDPLLPVDLVAFLTRVVPRSAAELQPIRIDAESIPDERLRAEALASIDGKAFHVAGACILATFLPPAEAQRYIQVVTPLETIYDYLDNLCDRHPDVREEAYPVLHRAIGDALDPSAPPRDYYERGPSGDDGGYLRRLVERTQHALRPVPHRDELAPLFADAASFYSQLQSTKHLPHDVRESACVRWYERHRERFHVLDWHEFACASGSNMHVFAALYEALSGRANQIRTAYDAYFPFVSALHILLDSIIDRDEDREHDDLNFAEVYAGPKALRERFAFMSRSAHAAIGRLSDARRHRFVLRVMTLFYLSHPKIAQGGLEREARSLLRSNGS